MLTSDDIKRRAHELGFDLCGIAPAAAFPELAFLRQWIDRGYAGTMAYLPRTAERRADVRRVVPSARSVIVMGTIYNSGRPYSTEQTKTNLGEVARYATSEDYHDVLDRRTNALLAWIRERHPEPFDARAYVDTGPVQERVYAQYAGLGWIGKNTCVINPGAGSWFLLSEIICSLALEPDAPALDQCGTCTLCLEACPTGAFVGPHVLDATRCISYLTIEYRGSIPDEHQAGMGNHLFGCDICQEVCPWNGAPALTLDPAWSARQELGTQTLDELSRRSDEELATMIAGTPLTRAGVKGLRRNLAIALKNSTRELRS
ncbi:MAG: tRNA epoxyqueuosine(34) reductase QueG [Vicinamibacterales bacterium]|nr:tRNA epoxyqueuosine(34) reductase QueG [Vicinamibacterales bacterium]